MQIYFFSRSLSLCQCRQQIFFQVKINSFSLFPEEPVAAQDAALLLVRLLEI